MAVNLEQENKELRAAHSRLLERLHHYWELHELVRAELGETFSVLHEMTDITDKVDEIEELYGE